MSFEVLPLIEFKPEQGLSHNKLMELVNSAEKSSKGKKGKDNWNQSIGQNQQTLTANSDNTQSSINDNLD